MDQKELIPIAIPNLEGNELKYVTDCIKTSWISSKGGYITKFEENFSSYCGTNHGVAVSNGTVALHLALTALGIGPGDEVIVPSLTFIASANSVSYCGAKPVFVDVDIHTWNMNPEEIEKAISPNTKAIMPVHLYGNPCDMKSIKEIADKYKLFIIEDAAEAHGAIFGNKKVGTFSDISCFSFFGNKVITTGEGGMCLTNDLELDKKMRVLRDHGMSKERKYWHEVLGFNYRMTNLQAAVGVAQLERIDEFLESKKQIAEWYRKYLSTLTNVRFQRQYLGAESIWWMTSIMFDYLYFDRDKLISYLHENGIDARPVFSLIHEMPHHKKESIMPIAKKISRNSLSLPSFVGLTEDKVRFICEKISLFLDKNKTGFS